MMEHELIIPFGGTSYVFSGNLALGESVYKIKNYQLILSLNQDMIERQQIHQIRKL